MIHFVRLGLVFGAVWAGISGAVFWWASRVPMPDRDAGRFRSSVRVGVAATVSWAVGSFVLLLWARRALIPADWVLGQMLTALGGGLLSGSTAALVGAAAGRMRWSQLGRR